KRLQRDGYVEGYGARLNPHLLGLGLLVFVEVLLDKTTPDVFERFAKAIASHRKCWSATWWRAGSIIWSRRGWPTWRRIDVSSATCCWRCPACGKREPTR